MTARTTTAVEPRITEGDTTPRPPRRLPVVAVVALAVIAVAVTVQLLVPPVVGIADDTTYARVMAPFGLRHTVTTPYFDHLQLDYAVDPSAATGAWSSSTHLVVQAALVLDGLLTDAGWLDLRAVGIVHAAILLVGVGALALGAARPHSTRHTVTMVGLALVLTDAAYVGYLNSLYTWPTALVGLIAFVGAAALAFRWRTGLIGIVALGLSGALVVAANGDVAPLAIALAAVPLLAGVRDGRRSRVAAGVLAGTAILGLGVWQYASQPSGSEDVQHYNVVFGDLLVATDDPEQVLYELGLPTELVRWRGTTYYEGAPVADPAFRAAFFDRITDRTLIRYYLTNPGATLRQLDRVEPAARELRVGYLGNHPDQGDGAPGRVPDAGAGVWTSLRRTLPTSLPIVLAVLVVATSMGIREVRRPTGAAVFGAPGLLGVLGLGAGIALASPVLLGGGTDIVARLPAFQLLFDLVLIGLVATALERLLPGGAIVSARQLWRSPDARRNLRLAASLARRTIFGRYRDTIFGVTWSVIFPLTMLAVYAFVFSQVFNARWDVETGDNVSFAVVLFSGLILFNFFSECVNGAGYVVANSAQLIKRTSVESTVLPLSVVLSALMTMGLSLIPFVAGYVVMVGRPPVTVLLFPIVFLPLVLLSYGAALAISAVSVYIRDVQQVTMIFTTTVLFMSPIFYPESAIPERFHAFVRFSPLWVPLIESKKVLFAGVAPDWSSLVSFTLIGLALLVAGRWLFLRAEGGFADVL